MTNSAIRKNVDFLKWRLLNTRAYMCDGDLLHAAHLFDCVFCVVARLPEAVQHHHPLVRLVRRVLVLQQQQTIACVLVLQQQQQTIACVLILQQQTIGTSHSQRSTSRR